MIYRVLSLLTIPLVLLSFYGVVRQTRKELPLRLFTPLIGLIMAPLSLVINIFFLNKAFSAFLGPALLITGLGFGLAWGQATRLFVKGPLVVGKRSVLHIIFWAVSFAITQVLATFAPALWVAGGLTAMFFSTGTGLGTNTNLLIRFLQKRGQRSIPQAAIQSPPPSLPEDRFISQQPATPAALPESPVAPSAATRDSIWRVGLSIIIGVGVLAVVVVPLYLLLSGFQWPGEGRTETASEPGQDFEAASDAEFFVTSPSDNGRTLEPAPTAEPLITDDTILIWSRPIWAFLTDGSYILYVVKGDGTDGKQILAEPITTFLAPKLSPDRSRFLFGSDRDGDREVYVIDVTGENLLQLTRNTFNDPGGNWSSDSQRIAIMAQPEGTWEIFVVDVDGNNLARLTENDVDDRWAVWSPDGAQIAYSMGIPGGMEIRMMNADGSEGRGLYTSDAELTVVDWSPNGSRVVISSYREGEDSEYYLMDIASLQTMEITAGQDRIGHPSFSPDGEWLLFTSTTGEKSDIYKMRVDGSDLINLSNSERSESYPCWLSNGAEIAYISYEGGDNWDEYFYVMNADGSNPIQVAFEPWPEDYMFADLACPENPK